MLCHAHMQTCMCSEQLLRQFSEAMHKKAQTITAQQAGARDTVSMPPADGTSACAVRAPAPSNYAACAHN